LALAVGIAGQVLGLGRGYALLTTFTVRMVSLPSKPITSITTGVIVAVAVSRLIRHSDDHPRRRQAVRGWSSRPPVRPPAELYPVHGRLPRLLGFD